MLSNRSQHASAAQNHDPAFTFDQEEDGHVIRLTGDWTTSRIGAVDAKLREASSTAANAALRLDLDGVTRIDTAGAWLIYRTATKGRSDAARIVGARDDARTLLEAVEEALDEPEEPHRPRKMFSVVDMLEAIGRGVYRIGGDGKMGLHILGATIKGAQMKLGRGHAVNPAAIVSQMDRMGIGAIPVVVLMSAIVGAIVAQQGAFQLRYFGAEIFVVDLVGILVLRELGVLLTAIMIAGRTGSAITAEVGSMKMREEVDALTVIGLSPVGVLVFPRLVALLIVLPCLTILANFAALGGAMSVTWFYSGIAPEAFIDRLHDSIDLSTILAGLIKAPFMAVIIGLIASVEGMKVEGSAESLGRRVTASVVKAIFIVIVVDGLFAMFYAAIDF